jgi:hypothetical protein
MGHDHAHEPGHNDSYFLDQVSTVAVCGVLAGVGFLAWKIRLFRNFNILTDQFDFFVLLGSGVLGALVVIRGVALWKQAGRGRAHNHHHDHSHDHDHAHDHSHEHHDHEHAHGETCSHDHAHEHGEACGHDHDHHDHEHVNDHHHPEHDHGAFHPAVDDHGHSHDFAPWRYAVMLLPLILAGLLLYYAFAGLQLSYSADRLLRDRGQDAELTGGSDDVAGGSSQITPAGFRELSDAANNSSQREYWDKRMTELSGLYAPISDRQFTLFRRKMTCCASDSVPIKVRIFSKESLGKLGLQPAKGVRVIGQIQFRKIKDSDEYVPVLVATEIKPTELGNDIFLRD